MAEPRFGANFERLWEAAQQQSLAADLDPALVETLRLLVARDRVPPPDPVFVRTTREALMATTTALLSRDASHLRSANGRMDMPLWDGLPSSSGSLPRRLWALAATLGLLLLVLAGSYRLFGPERPARQDPTPIVAPAVMSTPEATPQASGVTRTILIQHVASELPEWLYLMGINQSTRQPGGVSGLETYGGPIAHYVVSGALTIHSDHPTTVARGPAGTQAATPEIVPAGVDVVVNAGDTAIIPYGAKATTRNDGPVPMVFIAGVAEGPEDVSSFGTGFDMRSWPSRQAGALPKAPALVTYQHVVLSPGARFGHFAGPGWQIYGAAPEQWNQLRGQQDGSEINAGRTPVDLYVLTITPLTTGATPAPLGLPDAADARHATPSAAAVAGAGVTTTQLAAGSTDALPEEPSWLMTFHSTFRPGGRYSMELSEGPDLIAVRSGTMTYHADQPIAVLRGGADTGPRTREQIPADTDAVLQAGDAAVIPMGANVSRRNDGAEDAVEIMAMLEGTFLGSRGRGAPTSVVDLPIVTFHISDAHALPPAPATITLNQVMLAPGAKLPPPVAEWWMLGASEEDYTNLKQQPDGTTVNVGADPVVLYLTTVASVTGGTPVP